jgi:hypothetical protein
VEVRVADPSAMAVHLRTGSPSVFCRLTDRGVLLDARTIGDGEVDDLARAVQYAREADDQDDE